MLCVYIVNEEPAYIGMVANSVAQLRRYNPEIPIRVFYVEDGQKATRPLDSLVDRIRTTTKSGRLPEDFATFRAFCDALNVEIYVRKPPYDDTYHPLHRTLFQEIPEETVLLLDGDTFISGNIGQFPAIYSGIDFVATVNNYGRVLPLPIADPPDFRPFNSGVVLFQNGWIRRWAAEIHEYCRKLKSGEHPLSRWLDERSYEMAGREELAASLFVIDHGLSYRYWDAGLVQTEFKDGNPLIFHSLTPNWLRHYKRTVPIFRKKRHENS